MADEYCESRLILSIDKIKQILNITDTTHDDVLTQASPIVTEYFENYCGRGLAFDAEETEEKPATQRIQLFRYPLTEVTTFRINDKDQPIPQVNAARGWLYLEWPPHPADMAMVIYSGGYPVDCCPWDLADAYAHCVADFCGVAYERDGGHAGVTTPLKTLSLGSGALAVGFETAATIQSSVYETSDAPTILQPYVFTLRRYRPRDMC